MSLGENIKKYRKEKGLTQPKMAELTGISKRMIQEYEGERNTPPVNKLKVIAEVLDVSTDVLLDRENK